MSAIETPEFLMERLDKFGGPDSYNHYAVGWAHAMDTPYQWTKQVASHWGGTRNGTIVHWPNGIDAEGEMRWQFHHVIDVAPTILAAAPLPELLFAGMGRLSENCVLNIKNKSHAVTAEVEVPETGAHGVIIAQGGNFGGWTLYAHHGKLKYCYNLGGVQHFYVEATSALPAGAHQARMEFAYAGGGMGKGGQVMLYTDGTKVGEGEIPATLAMVFSADDGCDVGEDTGAPVSQDYGPRGNAFNGRVRGVQIAIADAAESG